MHKVVDVPEIEVKERIEEIPHKLYHERIVEVPEITVEEIVKQVIAVCVLCKCSRVKGYIFSRAQGRGPSRA